MFLEMLENTIGLPPEGFEFLPYLFGILILFYIIDAIMYLISIPMNQARR